MLYKKKNSIFTTVSGEKETTPRIERDQNWYLHKTNIYIYSGEAFVQRCLIESTRFPLCLIVEDTISCHQTKQGILKKTERNKD